MNVLENKMKKRSSDSLPQSQENSRGYNEYSNLSQEQEENILQLLEEYENALEEREFEEVDTIYSGQS